MAPRVCLAISAYRSDEAVIRLLDQAMRLADAPFEHVLVVDSLGSGAISREIGSRGWAERVEYRSFSTNLGSAGNLGKRLSIATAQGFDYVYAVNHDGVVDAQIIKLLLKEAERVEGVGAVYPLRRYSRRGGCFDHTGRTPFPIPALVLSTPPSEPAVDVHWGSSNGALYATQPLRTGLRVLEELWLGWEDLAWGWALHDAGYAQRMVTAAVIDDDYEYEEKTFGPLRKTLSDKPSWYSYYVGRNLILAGKSTQQGAGMRAAIALRNALELGVTVIGRSDRSKRVALFVRGIWDGLSGRSGKGPVP